MSQNYEVHRLRRGIQISDSLFLFNNRVASSNSLLIKKEKCVLIDPGTTSWRNLNLLLSQLKSLEVKKIDEIWLTHAHPDHSQAVRRILRTSFFKNSKVFCHPIAKEVLESPHPINAFLAQQRDSVAPVLARLFVDGSPKIKVINGIMLALSRWGANCITLNWRKIKVSGTFENGEMRNGIKVIYLPGHTPEELGFYLEDEKILITGDLIAHGSRMPIAVLNLPSSDIDDGIASLEVMANLDLKLIIPAHGDIIQDPKSDIEECMQMTQDLRAQAHETLHSSSNPYQVLIKWWRLYPPECRLQERLSMWGILPKSAILMPFVGAPSGGASIKIRHG